MATLPFNRYNQASAVCIKLVPYIWASDSLDWAKTDSWQGNMSTICEDPVKSFVQNLAAHFSPPKNDLESVMCVNGVK